MFDKRQLKWANHHHEKIVAENARKCSRKNANQREEKFAERPKKMRAAGGIQQLYLLTH